LMIPKSPKYLKNRCFGIFWAYFGHILGISNPLKHNMVLFLFQFQKALIIRSF
jgi:hypothetical protein